VTTLPRTRNWPERGLPLPEAVVSFLDFVRVTSLNKLAGLTEQQAAATPLASSPSMSLLGLVKHLIAVQRQHIQIHIGGQDLPSLWRADDLEFEFRLDATDTIHDVLRRFDDEWQRSISTLDGIDMEAPITAYGEPNTVGRLLVDVLQESARHLGHIDILREMIDGERGE
jgi:Protein of unknown function (DUF664)